RQSQELTDKKRPRTCLALKYYDPASVRILASWSGRRNSASLLPSGRRVFLDGGEKRLAAAGCFNLAAEYIRKGNHLPEEESSLVLILRNTRSAQVNARKNSSRT